jgi:hypothetical protein
MSVTAGNTAMGFTSSNVTSSSGSTSTTGAITVGQASTTGLSTSSTGAATTSGQSTTGAATTGGFGTTGFGGSSSTGEMSATSAGGASNVTSGTTGDATTTGGGLEVQPSSGCSNGNSNPSLNLSNTIVSLPDGYDGSTPVSVVMAFHAAGNPNTQLEQRFGDDLGDKYLMLYPKSNGNGWDNNADGSKVDAMFDALTSNACIDENRVFATGHSSGAQFIVQRLCAGESRWTAVAPVASSVYCSSWDPVPALVFHGLTDEEREAYGLADGNGAKDIVPYRDSNGCQSSSAPYQVDSCQSGGVQVDPGCVEFDGCSEQTIWCNHNDPQYGTSNHGIPCFADAMVRKFFDSF